MNNSPIAVTPTVQACPITDFVVALGKSMLREKVQDWLDMDAVEDFCNTHGIQLHGKCPSAHQLETALRQFLHPTGEFYTDGLNVDGYERPKGWDRPFQIRAYHYSMPGKTDSIDITFTEMPGSDGQNPEVAKLGNKASIITPPISHPQ